MGVWPVPQDLYRLNASYVQTEFRAVYEQHLYPRMHEHQRAIVVPAAYAAMGDDPSVNWSIPQYDATMQAIAWAAYNWTVSALALVRRWPPRPIQLRCGVTASHSRRVHGNL
jgi:hypothetical protein